MVRFALAAIIKPPHCRARRVLHLEPRLRSPRPIGTIAVLGPLHNAIEVGVISAQVSDYRAMSRFICTCFMAAMTKLVISLDRLNVAPLPT